MPSNPEGANDPAFPRPDWNGSWEGPDTYSGMTLRQYAAIHLKVPDSGTEWLDEMIRQARKLDQYDGVRHESAHNPMVVPKHVAELYQDARELNERPVGTICPIDPHTGRVIKT